MKNDQQIFAESILYSKDDFFLTFFSLVKMKRKVFSWMKLPVIFIFCDIQSDLWGMENGEVGEDGNKAL